MIEGSSVLAIITARGGSKGVPKKNIRTVAGKPLIAWTIEAVAKSTYVDRLVISTDDQEIMNIATDYGCEVPFKRPDELSTDYATSIDVVCHAVRKIEEKYHYLVLLQPTSPLRSSEDVDGCIKKCYESRAPACVSVSEPSKSPYWMYLVSQSDHIKPLIDIQKHITRRQDLPKVYALNGAVYVAHSDWLVSSRTFIDSQTVAYVMPAERSLDIDSEYDLLCADAMLNANIHENDSQ